MNEFVFRPCPFCGGDANLHSTYSRNYRAYYVNVRCMVCGSQGKAYPTKVNPEEDNWQNSACYSAISLWNRRVEEVEESED